MKRVWTVIETTQFQKQVDEYLSAIEQEALREYLVRHLYKGLQHKEIAEFQLLEWGKKNPLKIHYLVAYERMEIYLLSVTMNEATVGIISGNIKELLKLIKASVIGQLIKEIWEQIRDDN